MLLCCFVDINECDNGESECDSNAVCSNVAGMYLCTCRDGYSGDGYSFCTPGKAYLHRLYLDLLHYT